MKAKLRFDEESGKLIARLDKCPKGDGTFVDIEWEVGRLGAPFMGVLIPDDAIKAMDGQGIEVKDPERLWEIQENNQMSAGCKISPAGFKFRFHRGGYQDSMSTCVTLDSVEDLERLVAETFGLDTPLTFKFESEGVDDRNGWNSYLVTCDQLRGVVGNSDGLPPLVHLPVMPQTPETCPNCGAKISGGSTGPGEEMIPDHRVFYICGASISFKQDDKLLMLKNCCKLPESIKRYQYSDGKWIEVEEYGKPLYMTAYQHMKIRECIGLLNSMVNGGEQHSDVSKEAVRKALGYLNGGGV